MKKQQLLDTLAQIAKLAAAAAQATDSHDDGAETSEAGSKTAPAASQIGCSIKEVPGRLQTKAAEVATEINPVNAPSLIALNSLNEIAAAVSDPQFLTLLTTKYWGPTPRVLTVSFMETTPADLRARILSHMNAWATSGCISFKQTTGIGQIRISRAGSGYWSYLGTDVLLIPKSKPTMNLQGFSMSTPESEYKRVVRHETGHTLGFPHEHMRKELVARIDPQKAYAYFLQTQGWNKATVDAQVLTPLKANEIVGTAADQTSIMCYQLPGSITKDGQPILGGKDINTLDYAFVARIYPKPGSQAVIGQEIQMADDWMKEEDVTDSAIAAAAAASLQASATEDGLESVASANGVAAEV
jgi:hypothetical protein